jgi:hypothetical protein
VRFWIVSPLFKTRGSRRQPCTTKNFFETAERFRISFSIIDYFFGQLRQSLKGNAAKASAPYRVVLSLAIFGDPSNTFDSYGKGLMPE